MILTITDDQIISTLHDFLTNVLPNTPVFRGQENRVAEPGQDNFLTMTPIGRKRLATNIDTYVNVERLTFITFSAPSVNDVLVNQNQSATGLTVSVAGLTITAQPQSGRYFAVNDIIYNSSHPATTTITGTTPYASSGAAQTAVTAALSADLAAHPGSVINGNSIAYPQGGGKTYTVRQA